MAEKLGRPTDYTEELADEICDTIATSANGIPTLCKRNPHWPDMRTIFRWRRYNDSFCQKYMKAKQDQIEVLMDETIEIADDTSNDYVENGEGKIVANNELVNRSRLRIDTRKFLATKLAPRIYGDSLLSKNPEAQSLIEKILDKL